MMLDPNCVLTLFQKKLKGIFGGPLIIRTLATHYTATSGAATVPILGDPSHPSVALAISTCAV